MFWLIGFIVVWLVVGMFVQEHYGANTTGLLPALKTVGSFAIKGIAWPYTIWKNYQAKK